MLPRAALLLVAFAAVATAACSSGNSTQATRTPRPVPSAVAFAQEPQGVTLGDPAFEALPGARADFGRLGGSLYQIEMPDNWNGRLVLYMHGYGELRPETNVSPPAIRGYLIEHGYAWGASSFSSTSQIPGLAADETAALWDFFTQKYGRPRYTYVTGQSMGGTASHIAAERYADRFDGALALCGGAGQTPGAMYEADYFTAGAYVAGVTQAEFDASTDINAFVQDRIVPALKTPDAQKRFEDIMIDLTGGPRAFDRQGLDFEAPTNWQRATILVSSHLAPNADTAYHLGPLSTVSSEDYNRDVIRLPVDSALMSSYTEGNEITGNLQVPLLTLHTTGDGQVPIDQAQILQRIVDTAGTSDLLVQRVMRDPGHCGFTNAEWEAGLEALRSWVEDGMKPAGQDVLVSDLTTIDGRFELTPRAGSPEASAVPGAEDRLTISGTLTVDGQPVDSRFLGAVVRRDGLVTPCQYSIPSVSQGHYEIMVFADAESYGCGAPGAEVFLWTQVQDQQVFSLEPLQWPATGHTATFDGAFSLSKPRGAVPETADFFGDVFDSDGNHLPAGTRVEAYVGDVRCGLASTRRTGSFSGYILSVVGPDSVAGCDRGGIITFRIDGKPAAETSINDPNRPNARDAFDLTLP